MGRLIAALPSAAASPASMSEWCAEQNVRPIFAKLSRWYFVAERDGGQLIDTLSGCDADNLRKMLDGEVVEFVGWSEARMNGYRRWLQECARKGGFAVVRQLEAAE